MEDFRVERFPYSIVYLDRRLVAPRVRAFVDFLASEPPSFETSERKHKLLLRDCVLTGNSNRPVSDLLLQDKDTTLHTNQVQCRIGKEEVMTHKGSLFSGIAIGAVVAGGLWYGVNATQTLNLIGTAEASAPATAPMLPTVEGLCCKFSCGLRFSGQFNAEGIA